MFKQVVAYEVNAHMNMTKLKLQVREYKHKIDRINIWQFKCKLFCIASNIGQLSRLTEHNCIQDSATILTESI